MPGQRNAQRRRRKPAGVLLIFVDGVGVGQRGAQNPLDGLASEFFSIFQGESVSLPFNGKLAITDARLGVEGLPQSATGQTAILTGINAAALIGRHLHAYPSPRLKETLATHSVYRQLMKHGKAVTLANAYTKTYVENLPRHVSVSTFAGLSAGLRLRLLEDLTKGWAVCHDFTNEFLIDRGFEIAPMTPEQAGANLARIAAEHDFTFYEHFITDHIGHQRDRELSWRLAREHMPRLTRFVRAVLEGCDLETQTVIVTSDHGNLEDHSTRVHTMNPVATLAFGAAGEMVATRVRSLTDITPAIVDSVTAQPG